MNRQQTFDVVCTLLETAESEGEDVEDTAGAILVYLEHQGEELLEHLDPPVGLQRWLVSHGLVLVPIREAPAPAVWEALEEEEGPQPEEQAEELALQVGDYVEYRTVPTGPRGQSNLGAGWVHALLPNADPPSIAVRFGVGLDASQIILFPGHDFIRLAAAPPHTP